MRQPCMSLVRQNNILFARSFTFLLLCCMTTKLSCRFSIVPSSLKELHVQGHFSFDGNEFAANDFGNQFHFLPLAVLHPKEVSDIAAITKHVWKMGPGSGLSVVARGHGHSLQGQAQAPQGIVINMESLSGQEMQVHKGQSPCIDVSAGELWINILHESLKYGLAPKSWTDYLHLTVGGTLSNAGISGQAFRHGPQINNVQQLEVITGKGELVVCSEQNNADLFHGVLGGLGQFGIISRARISLERAPKMVKNFQTYVYPYYKPYYGWLNSYTSLKLNCQQVKWIRVLYSDFSVFARDQELLISAKNTFDYIEGIVIINKTNLINNWRSSFQPDDQVEASQFISEGRILFCLEMTKNFNPDEVAKTDQEIKSLLSQLSYIPSTLFVREASYVEFLDRVHTAELNLRSKGLWDLPHPWLNLLVPKSKIQRFSEEVFCNILTDTNNGPVLIYPVNKAKWNNKTSFVTPDEDIFYMVAFLHHAVPSSKENDGLEYLLSLNRRILAFCKAEDLGVKQYLPHYTTQEEWRAHFGLQWEAFVQRKSTYDPLAILAVGQRIFQKGISSL